LNLDATKEQAQDFFVNAVELRLMRDPGVPEGRGNHSDCFIADTDNCCSLLIPSRAGIRDCGERVITAAQNPN
jgi:hypothetical protein